MPPSSRLKNEPCSLPVALLVHYSKQKTETASYPKTLLNFHQTTRRHIPADNTLQR
jgi:hypothetical protein